MKIKFLVLGPKMIEFGRRPNWNCPKDDEDPQTATNQQVKKNSVLPLTGKSALGFSALRALEF